MSGFEKIKPDLVLMDRSYLKSWKQFMDNTQNRIMPRLAQLVKEEHKSQNRQISGYLHALRALAACR